MESNVWKPIDLHGRNGQRKYLNRIERDAFLRAAASLPHDRKLFCYVLACTGCRISEALGLDHKNLDATENVIIIESLKQRRKGVYRVVPVPNELISLLVQLRGDGCFFQFSRTTAWRFVKEAMSEAGIKGDANSMPKALRHSFGIIHAQSKTPPHLMKRWFGHAQIETTHIYLDAVGDEEREFASAIWPTFSGLQKKFFFIVVQIPHK